MIKTVLFDLDGTLVDTAPDLADALNYVLVNAGHEAMSFDQIRPVVSYGSPGLLRIGFGIDSSDERYDTYREQLLDYYLTHIADRSRPFEGIEALLEQLHQRGINWGVVTNKPDYLTQPHVPKSDLLYQLSFRFPPSPSPPPSPPPPYLLLLPNSLSSAYNPSSRKTHFLKESAP